VDKVAREVIKILPRNVVLLLNGDLASGKTTLVKSIVKLKGIKYDVTSPTFSLQHIYSNSIFHYDLYRVGFEELSSLGLIDEFEKNGWHIVEWVDEELKNILKSAGFTIYKIDISIGENGCRRYEIKQI